MSLDTTVGPRASSPAGDAHTGTTTDPYEAMADALVELAEAVYSLRGKGLPAPCHAGLVIQFHTDPFADERSDEQVAVDIDKVGLAVVAATGSEVVMTNGRSIHYRAEGQVGPVSVTVFQALSRKAGEAA